MLEFPRWKYAVILIVVVLSVLYASPNLFQKDPAVQVTKNRAGAVVDEALAERVRSILGEAGVEGARVALEGDQVLVRLPDAGTQTRAADALRPALGEDYTAALNLVPTTPAWLEALGARPMSLGLDLQGGVHFMMQVDQQAALEKRLDSYADAIRAALREARIGYTGAERRADATVAVTLANAGDAARARSEIQQALAGLRAPTALGGGPTVEVDGNRITVRLPEAELNRIATEAIEQNRNVISNRINAIGVAEPVLQRQGEDRLVIQLPGLQDTAEAKRLIGATATLEFRAVTGDEAQAAAALADNSIPAGSRIYYDDAGRPLLLSRRLLVSGDELVNAQPTTDPQTGLPAVSITLNSAAGKRMFDHTLENVGNRLGIVYVERIPTVTMVNGEEVRSSRTVERVISSSTIRGVFGKDFQTTGLSREEATALAKQLKAGALAAPMDFVEESVIGPTLGAQNVARGTKAVVYAFLFTLAFFAIYYRMFGLITCVALLLNLLMVVAVMSLFGATMTLPGFAGLALSIGMSVDANVLINERIREELRAGMPPRTAIATGYDKASGTIFDSNMTALLAGIALYAFGTGPLRGFAVTMVIGILTSVFTAVTVSRGIATLIYGGRRKLKSLAI
ncbi:protein translocase subunit SecD [Luteimonas wenzhouensis]|uniref:Protein translocase subunit SecD n=1 Tax=Luteimonas wenzhouensis TaxID=2599615 RepID=A0A5C5U2P7_9GAMM|nr:protein translocase subunit SecD [Luteimonas wenzhouensis]NLW97393.1 protein translocase subunit SecD [Xanthomonadaceae bacterium]TWT19872.1 protein translocase subunit SecD [Luteimonas wenzhouensis]